MEKGWTDVGSGGYILVSCAHSNTSFDCHEKLITTHKNNSNKWNIKTNNK